MCTAVSVNFRRVELIPTQLNRNCGKYSSNNYLALYMYILAYCLFSNVVFAFKLECLKLDCFLGEIFSV